MVFFVFFTNRTLCFFTIVPVNCRENDGAAVAYGLFFSFFRSMRSAPRSLFCVFVHVCSYPENLNPRIILITRRRLRSKLAKLIILVTLVIYFKARDNSRPTSKLSNLFRNKHYVCTKYDYTFLFDIKQSIFPYTQVYGLRTQFNLILWCHQKGRQPVLHAKKHI